MNVWKTVVQSAVVSQLAGFGIQVLDCCDIIISIRPVKKSPHSTNNRLNTRESNRDRTVAVVDMPWEESED